MPARVRLERPTLRAAAEFLAAVHRSRKLHAPWVKAPSTEAAYRDFVRRVRMPTHIGYLIRLRSSGELVGVAGISEIVRGSLCSAYLGYYAFAPHERQGLMTEGLSLVIKQAFGPLRLHRLEANVQPGNRTSLGLIRRLGFRREGLSPRYLKIRGRWRDHERWALLADG
ncbi:MAG TPA: GNAT family protein [Burkholderiales bacterium]|nr:GNAT family protein [Burkholderiales bacterium]